MGKWADRGPGTSSPLRSLKPFSTDGEMSSLNILSLLYHRPFAHAVPPLECPNPLPFPPCEKPLLLSDLADITCLRSPPQIPGTAGPCILCSQLGHTCPTF